MVKLLAFKQIALPMSNKHLSILLALAMLTGLLMPAWGQNRVRSVMVDVRLDSLGNAKVTEFWDVIIDSDNTEWYLAMQDLNEGVVRNLQVRDTLNGIDYETIANWNINATRAQKAGLAGIVNKGNGQANNSYELCWGVNSDGPHVWEVSYDFDNLVVAYSDSCAFNHMFISDGLKTAPETASVTISYPGTALTDEQASVWGFGYHGHIAYRDGAIVAKTDGEMGSDDGIVIMAAFDPSLFSPSISRDEPFATLKERAIKDSDYTKKNDKGFGKMKWYKELWWTILLMGFMFLCWLVMQFGALFGLMYLVPLAWAIVTLRPLRIWIRRKRLLFSRPWYRNPPSANDLSRVPYVLEHYSYSILREPSSWDDELTAAFLMRLIFEKALTLVTTTDEKGRQVVCLKVNKDWKGMKKEGAGGSVDSGATSGSLSSGAVSGSLSELKGRYSENDLESMKLLYGVLKKASGGDLILQKKEIRQFSKTKGQQMILAFYERRKINDFEIDKEEAAQIMGFKAFLSDFTLSDVRDINDVHIWNEYLVYATVFGIADRVLKRMKKVVPDYYKLVDKSICGSAGNGSGSGVSGAIGLLGGTLDSVLGAAAREARQSNFFADLNSGSYGGSSSRSSGGGGFSSYSGGSSHTGGGGGGGR